MPGSPFHGDTMSMSGSPFQGGTFALPALAGRLGVGVGVAGQGWRFHHWQRFARSLLHIKHGHKSEAQLLTRARSGPIADQNEAIVAFLEQTPELDDDGRADADGLLVPMRSHVGVEEMTDPLILHHAKEQGQAIDSVHW